MIIKLHPIEMFCLMTAECVGMRLCILEFWKTILMMGGHDRRVVSIAKPFKEFDTVQIDSC